MSSLFLHCVLLLAVAYSQVFGGVSCCCSFGSILPGIAAKVDVTGEVEQVRASTEKRTVPKCPRCAASRKSTDRKVANADLKACQDSWSHECRCQKGLMDAAIPTKPIVFSESVNFFSVPKWDFQPFSIEARIGLRLLEVPRCIGNRSWQSIACVWNQ